MAVRTFLDTCALISAAKGEPEVFNPLFEIIDDPNREFVGSDFLKLELLPKPTHFRRSEELLFYDGFFAKVTTLHQTTPSETASAFRVACQHGLSAVDALLVQAAHSSAVDEFVTTEKQTRPLSRITTLSFRIKNVRPATTRKQSLLVCVKGCFRKWFNAQRTAG